MSSSSDGTDDSEKSPLKLSRDHVPPSQLSDESANDLEEPLMDQPSTSTTNLNNSFQESNLHQAPDVEGHRHNFMEDDSEVLGGRKVLKRSSTTFHA